MSILEFITAIIISLVLNLGRFTSPIMGISQPDSASTPQTPAIQSLPPATQTSNMSINWSGYVATGGEFTGVTGTWTVPLIRTTNNFGVDATWVGVGGVKSHDLIQAGTQTMVTPDGQVAYQAFYETLPDFSQPLPLIINGGDSVTASVNQQTDGQWQITFKDNTTGQSSQLTVSYNSSFSSAEWVEEAPVGVRGLLPLDDFGTIQFTSGSTIKNGQTVTIAQANGQPVNMTNSSGLPLAQVSVMGNDGASFAVTRVNTSASTSEPTQIRIFRIPNMHD